MRASSNPSPRPWYADGLSFSCQQSGRCCTGGPGYVWISDVEIQRLAQHLNITAEQIVDRYCRRIGDRHSLNEIPNPQGQYDCVFLAYEAPEPESPRSLKVLHPRSVCTVYSVRPLQCRTWPFWEGNLQSKDAWERAARRCPGMNRGRRFTFQQIEALRNARDWPTDPPTV